MYGRTLAVIWHNVNNQDIWITHCHFNARKFDEVVSEDKWTFGRKGNSYVAIYSSVSHSFRKEGPYSGRELVCDGNETVWLAECGSSSEDGSFSDFIKKNALSQDYSGRRTVLFCLSGQRQAGIRPYGRLPCRRTACTNPGRFGIQPLSVLPLWKRTLQLYLSRIYAHPVVLSGKRIDQSACGNHP